MASAERCTEVLADDRALRGGGNARWRKWKHDLDILVLGRQANVRYVTGVPQLWVAGTRPFGPTCVLVRETGAIHLLSTWDEGVPEDIPHENLYGISWNPMNTIAKLQKIDAAAQAHRVGTDALSPVTPCCCRWLSRTPNWSTASRRYRQPDVSRRRRGCGASRGHPGGRGRLGRRAG